jgi:hypothetical protein
MGNPPEGYVSWIDIAGQEAFRCLPAREPEPGFRILERRPFFRRMAVRNPVFIGACIVRREVFDRIGRFEPSLCGAADWELWLRLASGHTYGFMAEPLAIYARHLDNMSSNYDRMIAEFCQALRNVLVKCEVSAADRQFLRGQLRHHLFGHAYLAYEDGRLGEARARFGEVLRSGGQASAALYWLACCLPGGAVRGLRRLKQAFAARA